MPFVPYLYNIYLRHMFLDVHTDLKDVEGTGYRGAPRGEWRQIWELGVWETGVGTTPFEPFA